MIDCDMPLEIGRIGNTERAAPSIIKRPRDVVSLVHRHEKKATWSCDRLIQRLGFVQRVALRSVRYRISPKLIINVLGKHRSSPLQATPPLPQHRRLELVPEI